MAIVLSRDDEIVVFINSFPYAEFRERFVNNVSKIPEFSAVLDSLTPKIEDLKTLRDAMIAAGIPSKLVVSDKQIREAAQAIMNRLIEPLIS